MKFKLLDKLNLNDDQASNEIIRDRIASGASINMTDMFILIFAILIACIGLNMDSTPIVIGAMLISPLMGSIVGIAYGISNYDLNWIKKCCVAFLFQIGISIITSIIYFVISPITVFSSELIARTEPNIFDVLIAILGGAAAIIANTRKDMISNVIPGAAIATALMPPLCTIGYCLVNHKWLLAGGALYLFSINCIFICLSAIIGLHIMKVTKSTTFFTSMKNKLILATIFIITIVPSSYLAAKTVKKNNIYDHYEEFIKNEFTHEDTEVIKSDLNYQQKQIKLFLMGPKINETALQNKLSHYHLQDYELKVIQTPNQPGLSKEVLETISQNEDILTQENIQEYKDNKLLLELQQNEKALYQDFSKELQILFPTITSSGFVDMYDQGQNKSHLVFVIASNQSFNKNDLQKMHELAKLKLKTDIEIQFLLQ